MIKKAIAKGAIISYITIIVNMVLTFLYTPWMIDEIGMSNYGLYSLVTSFIGYFLLDFGLSRTVQRFVANYRAIGNTKMISKLLGTVSKVYLLLDATIFLSLTIIYLFLTHIFTGLTDAELDTLKILYCIGGVLSIVNFIFKPMSGILKAYEYFVEIKLLEMFQKLGTIGLMFLVLVLDGNVYLLVLVNGLMALVTSIAQFILFKSKSQLKIDWSGNERQQIRALFIFSFWSFFLSMAVRFRLNLMPAILGITNDTTEISYFAVSRSMEETIFTLTAALNGLFLPMVSRLLNTQQDNAVMRLMIKVGRIQLFVISLIISAFIIFGHSFISLWLGTDFKDVYCTLLLLVIPYIVSLTQHIASDAILIENRIKFEALTVFSTSVLSFILAFPLSRSYGSIGCAIAIFVGIIINLIIMNLYYTRKMHMNIADFFRNCHLKILPTLVAYTALAFTIQYFINLNSWPQLFAGLILHIFVYCIIVYCLLLNQEEKQIVRHGFQ